MKDEYMDKLELLKNLLDIAKKFKESKESLRPSDEEIEKLRQEKIETFPFLKEFDEFTRWSLGDNPLKICSPEEFILEFAKNHPNLPFLEYDKDVCKFETQIILMFQAAKHYFNKEK